MAGKEHSSGPVIRHILPFFWILFLANVGPDNLTGLMDPKREEKHRIRANFGQKRVGGGVNREQKQRATEGWENQWGLGQVPPSCGKSCKTLGNSRAKRLGTPVKEGRRHKGKGAHRW
ncbi:hypothetical protein NPIL_701951 [Nephila pilipes]|uniref:Uncharacterized protein n=1 Tax=Nephila pilipes TaxID=299642 RepID=A0A8X6QWD0_NEPPI|nr:hypothetical protein NPIL_701951 [Nephila pilipes]